ncbi:Mediator of RNA polymerase II transcription subunit 31-like protein [Drosera capensis]
MSQSSIESGNGDSSSSSFTSLVNNSNVYKDPDDGRQRFVLELEFVQCLANPTYIHYLAQNRYFEDEAFIGYLKYLQYWQRPEYVKFIMYPHCLYFLELLQNSSFRAAMAHPGNKELAHRQQFYFWKSYRNNRLKHIIPRALPEPAAPSPATSLPLIPLPSTNASVAGVPSLAPSPMPYGIPPVAGLPNNDPRNNVVDRHKRKAIICPFNRIIMHDFESFDITGRRAELKLFMSRLLSVSSARREEEDQKDLLRKSQDMKDLP